MQRAFVLLAISLFLSPSPAVSDAAISKEGRYILSHVYIRLHPSFVSEAHAERAAARANLVLLQSNIKMNLFRIETPATSVDELEAFKATLKRDPCFKAVIFDFGVEH